MLDQIRRSSAAQCASSVVLGVVIGLPALLSKSSFLAALTLAMLVQAGWEIGANVDSRGASRWLRVAAVGLAVLIISIVIALVIGYAQTTTNPEKYGTWG
jgi:hypothetical protein